MSRSPSQPPAPSSATSGVNSGQWRVARDLRSKMSRTQLAIVKSFRVSLCVSNLQKFGCLDSKRDWKSVFEVSQLVQAGCVASFTHFNIASCIRDKVSP